MVVREGLLDVRTQKRPNDGMKRTTGTCGEQHARTKEQQVPSPQIKTQPDLIVT